MKASVPAMKPSCVAAVSQPNAALSIARRAIRPSAAPLGLLDIQRVTFPNGTTALLWANNGEPGRVTVKARFGAGWRAFAPGDAVYAKLGESALVSSGVGELGQEELDRISKDGEAGEDEVARAEKELQTTTDKYVASVDDLVRNKEAELLEV